MCAAPTGRGLHGNAAGGPCVATCAMHVMRGRRRFLLPERRKGRCLLRPTTAGLLFSDKPTAQEPCRGYQLGHNRSRRWPSRHIL